MNDKELDIIEQYYIWQQEVYKIMAVLGEDIEK